MRRRNELYFDFTSTSANGALAFGGGGGGGVDAGEVSGGSVSSTHATGRSGFGVRCSSSDMRSTRAARSSWELKYSMHKNERDLRGKLLNFGQLKFLRLVSSWPWMRSASPFVAQFNFAQPTFLTRPVRHLSACVQL